jgi:uncharacterized Zn finger protein
MSPKLLDAGRCAKCGDSEPKLSWINADPQYILARCVRCGYFWNVRPLDAGGGDQ